MTPDQIDGSFVPSIARHLTPVDVGDERVLLDGWSAALVLNPTGTLIWDRLDGSDTLAEVASDLAATTGADRDLVLGDVVAFTRNLGHLGLLDGVSEESDGPSVHLQAVPMLGEGDAFTDVELDDLDGVRRSLSGIGNGDLLVLNWNPHCGYCASIAARIAELEGPLDAAGVQPVLIAFGDADANRQLAHAAGITAPILLLGEHENPFGIVGTPSAVHLDRTLRVAAPPAHGNVEVPRLAASLAGIDPDASQEGDGVRYLLDTDGLCAPGVGDRATTWPVTRVYRIGTHHVGVRFDSAAAADVVDDLFDGRVVDDPRAGHSYSIALPSVGDGDNGSSAGLNLLSQPARATVRSRNPARVLRALLSDLHDRIAMDDDAVESEPADGRLRVNAIAVQVGAGAGLIPINFHAFGPKLQSLLARRGVALADAPHPEIDLVTAELVIPEPAIDHDATVLDRVAVPVTSDGEMPAVLPGGYPFVGWCVIQPGDHDVIDLSPAQAAATTLSSLVEADEPAMRLRQLGELFTTVPAYGLWYYSAAEVAGLVAQALRS